MAEVRVKQEGTLKWVRASGSGTSWATASAPNSGTVGFCNEFTFTSGATIQTMSDRGVPNHHKQVSQEPISLSFAFNWTGYLPTGVSGDGASVPLVHLEYRALEPEVITGVSGRFWQFYGVPLNNIVWTEGDPATVSMQSNALGMNGATASGYLQG
jgi:hypothetical protein